jgi:hypothetical protein
MLGRTTGKPLLQVKWGPEKDRLDMEEGVGVGVDVPHSGALTIRRGDRGAARAEEARGLPLSPSSAV